MMPSTPLNQASGPQIEAELLGRAIARGRLQIAIAEQQLALLREKQWRRLAESAKQANRDLAALKAPVRVEAAGDQELAYWQMVRRAYPEMCSPYVDLRIRVLEALQGKEAA